ncbi:MAG: sulfate transporter CysZ [Gammaproteobacteria bacterium]|nr:sulfate transporter CysZ [Gammaproteobacteria bacterium]MDE2345038.1 sulfate transporter CysZ [Gammaproteobacteria bacterium]
MLEDFIRGGSYLIRGFGCLLRPGVRRYVIIPLLLNTILFIGAIGLAGKFFENWLQHLTSMLPGWLNWLPYLLWPVFVLVIALGLFYGFSLIANIVGSPFNAFLSARVEFLACGRQTDSGRGLIQDIYVSVRDELRRIFYILWRTLLIGTLGLLLLFLPVLNILAAFLWFAFTAWMLAMQYSDYPLSNQGVEFRAQTPMLKLHRSRLFGFGCATALCTLIPVVNFVVMPAAVAGATLLWMDLAPAGFNAAGLAGRKPKTS